MALSDACHEFCMKVREAAREFGAEVATYGGDYPIHYGPELDALARACAHVPRNPVDRVQDFNRLLTLAFATLHYHDHPPGSEGWDVRKRVLLEAVAAIFKP